MKQIKSLEELKDLDKAVFRSYNVYKEKTTGKWKFESDGQEISNDFSTNGLLDVHSWGYYTESPRPYTDEEFEQVILTAPWVRSKDGAYTLMLRDYNNNDGEITIPLDSEVTSATDFFEEFEYIDGTVFGVKEC